MNSPLQRRKSQILRLKDNNGNNCTTVPQKLYALAEQFQSPPQPGNVAAEERKHYGEVKQAVSEELKQDEKRQEEDEGPVLGAFWTVRSACGK